ncbi:MAG: hypothetical protein ACKPJJ_33860, partial [Planctomycetaceae bacterium]
MPFPLRGCFCAGLLLLVAVVGCGPADDGRRSASGTITFQGKPLDRGNIMFVSPDGLGSQTGAV